MRKDVGLFLDALRKHWGSLVTSGALIGFVGIWQGSGHTVKPWVYWAIGLVGFVAACFFAWRDETRKTELYRLQYETASAECAAEIKRNSVPELELQLGQVLYMYSEQANLTTMLVSCRVTNHGATSPALGWQASLRRPGSIETVDNVHFAGPSYYWDTGFGSVLTLYKAQMLPALTSRAIVSGGSEQGRILFEFGGDVRHEFVWGAATLHVACTDRTNKTTWKDFGKGYPAQEPLLFPDEEISRISDFQIPTLPE
jgi:hypothetical protein